MHVHRARSARLTTQRYHVAVVGLLRRGRLRAQVGDLVGVVGFLYRWVSTYSGVVGFACPIHSATWRTEIVPTDAHRRA